MSRDPGLFLEDILAACEKVGRYRGARTREAFEADEQAYDAVLKNLEIIGEASKRLPAGFKAAHPDVPWREIAGLRDILTHEYFGLDRDIVWDVVQSRVPALAIQIRRITESTQ